MPEAVVSIVYIKYTVLLVNSSDIEGSTRPSSEPKGMTRLLFVIPPYFNYNDFVLKDRANVLPAFTIPYGVLSLETFLSSRLSAPIQVTILDLNIALREVVEKATDDNCLLLFQRLVKEKVAQVRPDVVGISALFNSSFRYMEDLAATAKAAHPGVMVLAGGGLPSAAFQKMLDMCPSIDAICKGEGELPLLELLESSEREVLLESNPAWITRTGLGNGKVPKHQFVQNLDDIPVLNYELVNLDDYNSRSIDKRFIGLPKREMAIHTSRGCPFLCVFCSNPSLHGRDVRTMSVDRVEMEVRRMKDQFGMTVLMIEDDHFFHDKERAKEILRRMINIGVRIEFPNGVAVYAINDEVASLFRQAGVSAVALAVESGSDYVLNHIIKKPLKKKLVKPAVNALRKHGVLSHVFIVIGLPGELDEHREETRQMLLETGFDWAHVYCAIPIYGSRLYDICADNGYIENTNPLDFIDTKSVIRAPGVDPKAIERMAYDMNLGVNFVGNFNLAIGNYDVAAKYFRNVCEKYPDHAFGHYFLALTLERSGGPSEEYIHHYEAFEKIIELDAWWAQKAAEFKLQDTRFLGKSTALSVSENRTQPL
jgi:radical SAM superfamily enzyme YgiQ (UPF0313 family)